MFLEMKTETIRQRVKHLCTCEFRETEELAEFGVGSRDFCTSPLPPVEAVFCWGGFGILPRRLTFTLIGSEACMKI